MLATLPHGLNSPLPMLPSIAILQWITSNYTSPSLTKALGPRRKSLSLSPSTPFQTSPANSPPSSPRNSTSGLNPEASYTPMTWVASLFVPKAATATLFWNIMSTPTPSSSQRSNHATTGITLIPMTASCLASNSRATALIYKYLTMRLAPSIVAPSLMSGTAPYSFSR